MSNSILSVIAGAGQRRIMDDWQIIQKWTYGDAPTTITAGPALPNDSYYRSCVLTNNGKAVLIPGINSDIGLFDIGTETFIQGPLINTNGFLGGCLAQNGNIILAPGNYGAVLNPNIGIYNPTTNIFSNGPAHGQASGSTFSAAIAAPNGKVILAPGNGSAVWGIYDPVLNTYTNGPTKIASCNGAVLHPNGKIYGAPNGTTGSTKVQIYDPATNTVTSSSHIQNLTAQRGALLSPTGKIVLIPGSSGSVSLSEYDPDTDTVTQYSVLGFPSSYGGCLLPSGKMLFAFYGTTGNFAIYDSISHTLALGPANPTPTKNTTWVGATLLPNGKVIVVPAVNWNPQVPIYILSGGKDVLASHEKALLSPYLNKSH